MKRKVRNPNRGLMWGIAAMAVIVLAVVVVFWYWCFPGGMPVKERKMAGYDVLLAAGFCGDSVQLMVDDSLVFSARVREDSLEVPMSVPAGEHLLMVACPEDDRLSSFELPAEGGRVSLHKDDDGEVEMSPF